MQFYIVDVFAERPYAGNQLAVFRDAGGLSDEAMQHIAREMNFSETTFIRSEIPRNDGYDVRIFTPRAEVPFAGHPTLGTAYIIQHAILPQPIEQVNLNLAVGQIPVSLAQSADGKEILWMTQNTPTFGEIFEAERLASVLGLELSELDAHFPIEEASTGLPAIIVPVKTLKSVRRIKINTERYFELVDQTWAKMILVFCAEPYSAYHDLNVRVFVDYYGIPEDPATGSGNGNLAAYLVKHRYLGSSHLHISVEQGYEIQRPSLLFLKAEERDGVIEVLVGGCVVNIAQGEWLGIV
jgi:trans-2,3-dihydro-3-hydroxyanthranilate isomerase